MTSVTYKTINGKRYLYAEHSFRLPNGKIKKISNLNDNEIKNIFLNMALFYHIIINNSITCSENNLK